VHLEEIKGIVEKIARLRGWSESTADKFVSALTELGEAGNAWKRNAGQDLKAEELADIIISTLDLSRVMCPNMNMDNVVVQKLRKIQQTEELVSRNYLVVDVSAFLSRRRLAFLLKLLEEKELVPNQIVLADKLYSVLSTYVKEGALNEDAFSSFLEIARNWEGPYPRRTGTWIRDEEFLILLKTFFERWKPTPAGELIGYDKQKNPIDPEELRKKLGLVADILYDELKTAEKARSCIICLSRGLARLLKKTRHFLIEIPHAKKKVWMEKNNWVGGLLFFIVTGVTATHISAGDIENLLSDLAKHASPITRNLLADVNIPNLAHGIVQLLGPTVASVVFGTVSIAIAFDSISYPRVVFEP